MKIKVGLKGEEGKDQDRGKWYGLVSSINIQTKSSGTYSIIIESDNLNKDRLDDLLNHLLILIRAPESVEANYD